MNFNFPTDNLYKFITIIGLTFLCYGLISENKYTDLTYKKTSEINAVWKKVKILDYEYKNPTETITDSISELKRVKNEVYELNLLHKEMEFLISDWEELVKLEKKVKNKNRWISMIGLIILLIGLLFWYLKTQRKLDKVK